MATNAQVVLTPQTLPAGLCPSSAQDWLNTVAQYITGNLPGSYSTFVLGNATPAVTDQNKPWIRQNSDGTFDKIYTFGNGAWTAPHPLFAGAIILWAGDITTINSLDGGDGTTTVTTMSGPFWQELTDASGNLLRGRFPLNPDPLASVLTTAVNPLDIGGEQNHLLVTSEMPSHIHNINLGTGSSTGGPSQGSNYNAIITNGVAIQPTGGDNPHNNMPPYVGLWIIQRTGRIYYTA